MDGAMGTMLRRQGVSGNLSDMNLTDPERVAQIHSSYINSGAELIETNTFSFAALPGQECCSDKIYGLSRRGAEIARNVAEEEALSFMLSDDNDGKSWKIECGSGRAIVAGCIGACNQSSDAYRLQAEGLIDGGADVLLVESIYDLQIAEKAFEAIAEVLKRKGEDIPVMASATIDREGKILSGEDFRTVFGRLEKFGLFSLGFNCSFGAEAMIPYAVSLKEFAAGIPVSICPSAGLPDNTGKYPEGPAFWTSCISKMRCPDGTPAFNFAGGCCGTTPEYIKALTAF